MKILISYNRKNRSQIQKIVKFFESNNIDCWFDAKIKQGDWMDQLDTASKECDLVLFFVGAEGIGNTQKDEMTAIHQTKEKEEILPIILPDGNFKEMNLLYQPLQRIDINNQDIINEINKLIEILKIKNSKENTDSLIQILKLNDSKNTSDPQVIIEKYDNVAPKQEYDKLLIEINKLRKHDFEKTPGKLPQSVFYIELKDKLSELLEKKFDCVIIHGPQLTGKKTLVSHYISLQTQEYVIPYDGTRMDLSISNKRSTEHIFASWLKAIFTSLINLHKDNLVLNDYQEAILNNQLDTYKKFAENIKVKTSAKYYTGFDILNAYFDELFKKARIVANEETKIIIEFAIRNFQKMFTDSLYENFMQELKQYIQSDNRENSFIEFIIISRYIHPEIINQLGDNKIVINTRFFRKEELGEMLSPIIEVEKMTKIEEFVDCFFHYTNGYQYFVVKLIYLYLSERINDKPQLSPIELLKRIYENEDYWINFGNIHDNDFCTFRKNINNIKSFYKDRNKTKHNKYLEIVSSLLDTDNNLDKTMHNINDVESENNDYYANDIIVSSGIFKYIFDCDCYEAKCYGNPIIEKHIVPKLVKNSK